MSIIGAALTGPGPWVIGVLVFVLAVLGALAISTLFSKRR